MTEVVVLLTAGERHDGGKMTFHLDFGATGMTTRDAREFINALRLGTFDARLLNKTTEWETL